MEQNNPRLPAHTVTAETSGRGSLICWKSVIGGVFVTLLAYMIFSSLGAGIWGLTASHIIEKGENGSGLTAGAGLWLGASSILSLFLGSYFATRYSDVTHKQVGACQSILIAAIFFFILVNVTSASFSSFAEVAGNLAHANAVSDADAAAKTIGDAGWLLFVTLTAGVVAAIVGGIEGVMGNVKRPFTLSSTSRA